jgi:thiol-disulfide isomerase/thioredoxin
MAKKFFFIFLLLSGLVFFSPIFAQTNSPVGGKLEINFFYSETCPHCKAEQEFLDTMQEKYPQITINRYLSSNTENRKLMIDLLVKHEAEKYTGLVPLTFVGEEFFMGFDNADGVGKEIEASIQKQLGNTEPKPIEDKNKIKLPLIGEVDLSKYSLFGQAFVLGFFDGFNVCSLGALILILGLVLILRSRMKILLFGGAYILTTAIIYGLLIVLWYKLFYYLGPVLNIMNVLVGVLGILGAVYFFRQFLKFKKYGPTCDTAQNSSIVSKFSQKIQNTFKETGGIWGIIISIFIFAAVITVVEFPCSAVIPVLFAGILAKAQLSTLTYLFYIALYIFFYMLDEIIVFLIAVFTMNIKIASGKSMIWLSLIEAIVLFGLGIYYLAAVF